jgi:hypothetical protein
MSKKLLTPRQTSEILNISINSLRKQRSEGRGLPFIKIGVIKNKPRSGVVRYSIDSINKLLEEKHND